MFDLGRVFESELRVVLSDSFAELRKMGENKEKTLSGLVNGLVSAAQILGVDPQEVKMVGVVVSLRMGGLPDELKELFGIVSTTPQAALATQSVMPAIQKQTEAIPESATAKQISGTAPPRTLPLDSKPNGNIAEKVIEAAAEFDLGPLPELRKLLSGGVDKEKDWVLCRRQARAVVNAGLVQSEADWELIALNIHRNFIPSGDWGKIFLSECPKPVLARLLLEPHGLRDKVELLAKMTRYDDESVIRMVHFVFDVCQAVDKEVAKDVLFETKSLVNRLEHFKFINRNHPLWKRLESMKAPKAPTPVRGNRGLQKVEGPPVSAEMPTQEFSVEQAVEKVVEKIVAATDGASVPTEDVPAVPEAKVTAITEETQETEIPQAAEVASAEKVNGIPFLPPSSEIFAEANALAN